MYRPAPPRPKLTDITRTRSGCKECRKRRVKCDEKKPSCGACVRRGKQCEAVQLSYRFRTVSVPSHHRGKGSIAISTPENTGMTNVQSEHSTCHHTIGDMGTVSRTSKSANFTYQLPDSNLVRSLNRSENELFYLTHWENSCLASLDRFHKIRLLNSEYRPLRHAMLALSACNLSRYRPEKDFSPSSQDTTYRPDRQHQAVSQSYYTSALGQVAKVINKASSPSSSHTLAVLVVFCYIESTMGTFPGFGCHAEGISNFVQAQSGVISADICHQLFSAYILARYQNWWRRLNFSSFSFQLGQPRLSLSADHFRILRSVDAKRTILTSILCESFRLNIILSLRIWSDHERGISDKMIDEYTALLDHESRKLDEWEATLSPSELPNESLYRYDPAKDDSFWPLLFLSHECAMNYAYYAVARIMQCAGQFTNLQTHNSMPNESVNETESISFWETILIRIIAGLDKLECAKRNVYSIGVSSLLMACLPRCNDFRIGQWIENWLRELSALSVLEEGSFPVAQALALAILVNRERSMGNEVYAIGLPQDDGGGCGKYSSYNSQNIDIIAIKYRRKGCDQYFAKHVSLWAQE